MNYTVANIVITSMAVTFFLLATQAEPFTATLGFVFGAVLFLSVVRQTTQQRREHDAGELDTTE
jgi:hypothetical protein